MHFFLRKHTYFHGSDILLDLNVICYALDFHNWVDFQRSFANKNCLSGPFNAELCSKRYWWGLRSQEVKGVGGDRMRFEFGPPQHYHQNRSCVGAVTNRPNRLTISFLMQ